MNLESLHVNWETPIEIDEESFDNGIYDNTILFVPKGYKKEGISKKFPLEFVPHNQRRRRNSSDD